MAVLALLLAIGCVDRSHVGYFDDHAFYSVRQHYRIRYLAGASATRSLLGAEWRPTSIRFENGLPSEGRWNAEDRTVFHVDRDGDGRFDVRTQAERFDLRFEHRENGASLMVRTTPMAGSLRQRRLDVLVHDVLEAVASHGARAPGSVDVANVLYEGPATVGGAEAYQAIFEGAALGPTGDVIATSTDRAHLVMVRPHVDWHPSPGETRVTGSPMVVSFWLVARREHFDALEPALASLLERTDFRDPDAR